jgi:hypothetical protein
MASRLFPVSSGSVLSFSGIDIRVPNEAKAIAHPLLEAIRVTDKMATELYPRGDCRSLAAARARLKLLVAPMLHVSDPVAFAAKYQAALGGTTLLTIGRTIERVAKQHKDLSGLGTAVLNLLIEFRSAVLHVTNSVKAAQEGRKRPRVATDSDSDSDSDSD